MVLAQVFAPVAQGNEFDRYDIAPLVQHLEKSMLPIGAGLAPDHRCSGGGELHSILVDAFAIALHLQLLQIGRQAAQAVAVWGNAAAGKLAEIAIPDVQQSQAHREIALHGRSEKVGVHRMSAVQQSPELLRTYGDGDRQADGGPQRKASAHPVPETQCALYAEFRRSLCIGGEGHEVLVNRAWCLRICAAPMVQKPLPGRASIQHGLGRGEGFGGNQKQRAFRFDPAQHMSQLVAVHIGDKVKVLVLVYPVLKGIDHDFRTQVRAADADIDDIGDLPAALDLIGQGEHSIQRVVNFTQRRVHVLGPGP